MIALVRSPRERFWVETKFVRSRTFPPLNSSKHWLLLTHAANTVAALRKVGGRLGEIWVQNRGAQSFIRVKE